MMKHIEEFKMYGQHEWWHRDHLNWMSDVNLWTRDLVEFRKIMQDMQTLLKKYELRLDLFRNEIANEEFHIKQHEACVECKTPYTDLDQEHSLLNEKHKNQKEEFEKLKISYHQLNLLMRTFAKGITKIDGI